MNCYFCKQPCNKNAHKNWQCEKHPLGVSFTNHFNNELEINIWVESKHLIVYINATKNQCCIIDELKHKNYNYSKQSDWVISNFDFIPNFTPENAEQKIKTLLPFL